jgi:hypothetical protein
MLFEWNQNHRRSQRAHSARSELSAKNEWPCDREGQSKESKERWGLRVELIHYIYEVGVASSQHVLVEQKKFSCLLPARANDDPRYRVWRRDDDDVVGYEGVCRWLRDLAIFSLQVICTSATYEYAGENDVSLNATTSFIRHP